MQFPTKFVFSKTPKNIISSYANNILTFKSEFKILELQQFVVILFNYNDNISLYGSVFTMTRCIVLPCEMYYLNKN